MSGTRGFHIAPPNLIIISNLDASSFEHFEHRGLDWWSWPCFLALPVAFPTRTTSVLRAISRSGLRIA